MHHYSRAERHLTEWSNLQNDWEEGKGKAVNLKG